MTERMARLESILRGMGGVMVAFSGGADSTLLLYAASRFLGEKAAAGTVFTPLMTADEIEKAGRTARLLGVRHVTPELDVLGREEIASNPPQRCYHCKLAVLGLLKQEAERLGLRQVIDATQADDLPEFRPGMLAVMELGVRSPLAEAGFTKEDVRHYLRIFNLPGADRPSRPCLATRIPYGTRLTVKALKRVEAAEAALEKMGFPKVRVRDHFPAALVEVPADEVERLASWPVRRDAVKALKELGYAFVAADLQGYRPGSLMEAVLEKEKRRPRL